MPDRAHPRSRPNSAERFGRGATFVNIKRAAAAKAESGNSCSDGSRDSAAVGGGACSSMYEMVRPWVALPGENRAEVIRKITWLTLMVVALLSFIVGWLGTHSWAGRGFSVVCIVGGVLQIPLLVVFLLTKRMPRPLQLLVVVSICGPITAMDMYLMPSLWRMWASFIIVVDVLLVVGAPRMISFGLVLWVIIWLAVAESEYAFRWGLLDVPGMPPYEERRERFMCDEPPCATGGAGRLFLNLLPQFTVFVMDFYITRGFAQRMRREKGLVSAPVSTAQKITVSLARFDLDAAGEALSLNRDQLPPELFGAFSHLLHNLGTYRPFLPSEFFLHDKSTPVMSRARTYTSSESDDVAAAAPRGPSAHDSTAAKAVSSERLPPPAPRLQAAGRVRENHGPVTQSDADRDPPADMQQTGALSSGVPLWMAPEDNRGVAKSQDAALVFITVHESSALWEENRVTDDRPGENIMQKTMMLYSEKVHYHIHAHDGYEIKTVGDSFMLAFRTPDAAVKFAVALQAEVGRDGVWPSRLSRAGVDDGFDIFALSIGVHAGTCIVERSALTGGYDYYGRVVRATALVEGYGIPGAVVVSAEVMEDLDRDFLDGVIMAPFEQPRHAYDSTESLWLTALLPRGLERLEPVMRSICDAQPDVAEVRSLHHGGHTLTLSPCSRRSSLGPGPDVRELSGEATTISLSASVAVVKFAFYAPHANLIDEGRIVSQRLEVFTTALTCTSGLLSSVIGNIAVVSWGVHKRCAQHVVESVRFTRLLHDGYRDKEWQQPQMSISEARTVPPAYARGTLFHAGVASGAVASGLLRATASQQFVSLLGPCLDLGMALCYGAAELDTHVLLASFVTGSKAPNEHPYLRGKLRQVDAWLVDTGPAIGRGTVSEVEVEPLPVWELLVTFVPEVFSTGGMNLYNGDTAQACSSPRAREEESILRVYNMAYHAGDVRALRALGHKDPVAARVAQLLAQGTHLQHALTSRVPVPTGTPPLDARSYVTDLDMAANELMDGGGMMSTASTIPDHFMLRC